VQKAQIVIGSERSLNLFRDDIKGETLTLTGKNVDELLTFAQDSAAKGKAVVLLSAGDSGFSGLLGSVLSRTGEKNVEVNVIAGVSALQVCAARLGMCWEDAALFTFHSGVTAKQKEALVEVVKAGKDVFLLPETKTFAPSDIAACLVNNGVDKATRVAICENLTLGNERIVESTLEEAAKRSFSSMCVMVIRS
jgi:cobalt-precorrin-7 (C5)-methyltransferase